LRERGLHNGNGRITWISVPCNFCGLSGGKLIHREGQYKMWKCPSCDFIYLNPRPDPTSLRSSYQNYLPEDELGIERWRRMMMPVFSRAADYIEKNRLKGKIVDVGTGYGHFPLEMEMRGWEALGLEISGTGVEFGRKRLGVNILAKTLEESRLPDNHFDAITAFYLIEHLDDPMAFLRECHRVLKPGGLILLRYPHTTPIKDFLGLLGIPNRLYDAPYHLNDFSPKTIGKFLSKAGFTQCQSFIGGYTLPAHFPSRAVSRVFGSISQGLSFLSGNRFLFPGVSKTATARKCEALGYP
jgi:SAM-dependent methyltransferase